MDGICDPWIASSLSCSGSDACPNSAEDMDSWKDASGCSEPDNDADGFPDSADLGGPAVIDACGVKLTMPSGTETVVTCGSATIEVIDGPVTVSFDPFEASVPTGTTIAVQEVGPGVYDVSNFAGSASSVFVGGLPVA